MSDGPMKVSEPVREIFRITADNILIWNDPIPVADPAVILAATDVVAGQYGLVRRECLEAAEAKLAKAMGCLRFYAAFYKDPFGNRARIALAELEKTK